MHAVNTAGAALGCFLTDFTLVPAVGLQRTQLVAVGLNVVAGLGALYLSSRATSPLRLRRGDAYEAEVTPGHDGVPLPPVRLSRTYDLRLLSSRALRLRCRDSPRWAWRFSGSAISRFCWAASARCSRSF